MSVKLTAPHPVHGEVGTVITDEADTMLEHELVQAGYAIPTDAAGRRRPAPKDEQSGDGA